MKKKPNLILLRHGQSYTNSGKMVDHEHQNLLTLKGIENTLRQAKNLRMMFPDMHVDHAFVSPLHRAMQTNFNFLSAFDNRPVFSEVVPEFEERNFGFDSYIKIEDMLERFGEETVNSWEIDLHAIPGDSRGESMARVYARVVKRFQELVLPRIDNGETVLITAHYYILKCLQSYLEYGDANHVALFDPRNSQPYLYSV